MKFNPEADFLYRDDCLAVVNKNFAMPVHRTVDAARPNLHDLIEKHLNKKVVLFHRLDRDTTGCIVIGLNPKINKAMSEVFLERKIKKTYRLLCEGRWLPEWRQVESFIGKKHGGHWDNFERKNKKNLYASTHFKVLKSNGQQSLLEAELETGRTHQIRLHCKKMQHPIVNDPLYGKVSPQGIPIYLHAQSVVFPHPLTQKALKIEAPLPEHWNFVKI